MTACDVLIIGAGPAGSVAATLLARDGLNVRLVDKKPFPRRKVCGACLSGYAVSGVVAAGLERVLSDYGAVPLESFRLAATARSATVPLHAGYVLSRLALDAALAQAAVSAGATFHDNTTAELGPIHGDTRLITLRYPPVGNALLGVPNVPDRSRTRGATGPASARTREGAPGPAGAYVDRQGWRGLSGAWPRSNDALVAQPFSRDRQGAREDGAHALPDQPVRAKVVLIAAGLAGAAFRHDPELRSTPAAGTRIGAGAEAPDAPDFYSPGTIFMATHRAGYVGLVRTETGSLNIAAALDPRFVTAAGGPGPASATIVHEAGFPAGGVADLDWTGAPPLTRHPAALAADRVFLIGDAAGYVEPFTGEGIGWAIGSATAVVPFVHRALAGWCPAIAADWAAAYRRTIGRRQRLCRLIARGLRSPAAVSAATRLLAPFPRAATPILRHLAAT